MRPFLYLLIAASALSLAGCSSAKRSAGEWEFIGKKSENVKSAKLDPFAGKGSPYFSGKGPVPRGGGRYHVGKPYQVAGRWYTPKEQPGYDKTGQASWYGEAFHRRMTSNGEYFDMNMLSAAHPTLPIPSYAKVTNLENGRAVIVRINDRGPFVGTRIIDLSKKSAQVLDFKHKGKANVRVQWLGNAPLNDQGQHLAMMNQKLEQGAGIKTLVAAAGAKSEGAEKVQVAARNVSKRKTLSPDASLQQASFEPAQKLRKSEDYIIRAATFSNEKNAEATRQFLEAFGPVQVLDVERNGARAYLVQLGPFTSKIGAQEALAQIQAEGFPEAKLLKVRIVQTAAN